MKVQRAEKVHTVMEAERNSFIVTRCHWIQQGIESEKLNCESIANQLRSLKAHVGWLVGVLFPSSCLRRGTHPIAIKLIQLERLGLPVYSFQRWYFQFWSTIKYFSPWERFFTSTCSPKVTGRSFDWAQYVRESFGCFVFLYFAIWYGAFAICHLAAVQRWQFFVCSFVFLLLYVFIVLYFVIYCGAFAFCICPVVTMTQFFSYVPFFVLCLCLFVFLYFAIYCDAFGIWELSSGDND